MPNRIKRSIICKSTIGVKCSSIPLPSCKLDEYNPAALSEQDVLTKYDGWKAFQSNTYTGLWGTLIGMPYGICF